MKILAKTDNIRKPRSQNIDIFSYIGKNMWIKVKIKVFDHYNLHYAIDKEYFINPYSYFEVPDLINCYGIEYKDYINPNNYRIDKDHWYGFYQFHPSDITIAEPCEIFTHDEMRDLFLEDA